MYPIPDRRHRRFHRKIVGGGLTAMATNNKASGIPAPEATTNVSHSTALPERSKSPIGDTHRITKTIPTVREFVEDPFSETCNPWPFAEADPLVCANCGCRMVEEEHMLSLTAWWLIDNAAPGFLGDRRDVYDSVQSSSKHVFQRCFPCLARSLRDEGPASFGPLPNHGTEKRHVVDRFAGLAELCALGLQLRVGGGAR